MGAKKKTTAQSNRAKRDKLYTNIIRSITSSLKKYEVKDVRWALNRWAQKENAKARLRREIEERQNELKGIK